MIQNVDGKLSFIINSIIDDNCILQRRIVRNMNKEFDVLIVGSGPAGVSTWLYLYEMNPDIAFRTLVLEKDCHPRHKLCGGAILNPFARHFFKDLHIDLQFPNVHIHNV